MGPNQRVGQILGVFCAAVFSATCLIDVASASPRQDKGAPATVRLTNKSELALTAKLVGPTAKAFRLRPGGIHRLQASPGNYYLFYAFYHPTEKKSFYLRTELFTLKAGEDIEAEADSDTTNNTDLFYVAGYRKRLWLLESDFNKPPGWPAEGVKVEENASFATLKVLATIGDLYLADRDYEASYVTGLAKAFVNRRVPRDVLAPLRRQGFRATFGWTSKLKPLPEQFSEPTLVITYEESEGRKFMTGPGVYVALRFSLYGAGDKLSEPIWEEEVGGTNDDEVNVNLLNANGSFRSNSLADLRRNLDMFELDLSQWKSKP